MSIKNIFNTQISTNIKEIVLFYYLQAVFPLMFFFLLSKTFLYWATFRAPEQKHSLYQTCTAHTQKNVKPLTLMCYLYLISPLM